MKIIKQELEFEECLKQRLEFICEFSKVTPAFINGSIRKLDKTNLTYIEPHRVIIKNILIVAHSGVSKAFSGYFEGISDGKFLNRGLKNCEIKEYNL